MTESANPHTSSNNWREALDAGQRERDPHKFAALVTAAEEAMFIRWQEMNANDSTEFEEIDRAIATLRELQVKKFNFPSWEQESSNDRPNSDFRPL